MERTDDSYKIIDVLWINIFQYCNAKEYLTISQSCKHFYNITTNNESNQFKKRVNEYWKYQSILLSKNQIQSDYETQDWKKFYFQLKYLLIETNHIKYNDNNDNGNGNSDETKVKDKENEMKSSWSDDNLFEYPNERRFYEYLTPFPPKIKYRYYWLEKYRLLHDVCEYDCELILDMLLSRLDGKDPLGFEYLENTVLSRDGDHDILRPFWRFCGDELQCGFSGITCDDCQARLCQGNALIYGYKCCIYGFCQSCLTTKGIEYLKRDVLEWTMLFAIKNASQSKNNNFNVIKYILHGHNSNDNNNGQFGIQFAKCFNIGYNCSAVLSLKIPILWMACHWNQPNVVKFLINDETFRQDYFLDAIRLRVSPELELFDAFLNRIKFGLARPYIYHALHWACVQESPEIVSLLVDQIDAIDEYHSDHDIAPAFGLTANATQMVSFLASKNASFINSTTGKGSPLVLATPLIIACAVGNTDIVKTLLACKKIDIDNCVNTQGMRALEFAIDKQHYDIMELLLQHPNCDLVNYPNMSHYLFLAIKKNQIDMIKLVLNHGYNILEQTRNLFLDAAYYARNDMIEYIWNFLQTNGDANCGENSIAEYVNRKDSDSGKTPYIMACQYGDKETVNILINLCKIDATIKDDDGKYGSQYIFGNMKIPYHRRLKKWLEKQEKQIIK